LVAYWNCPCLESPWVVVAVVASPWLSPSCKGGAYTAAINTRMGALLAALPCRQCKQAHRGAHRHAGTQTCATTPVLGISSCYTLPLMRRSIGFHLGQHQERQHLVRANTVRVQGGARMQGGTRVTSTQP
jgi:hypothetical protein